MPAPKRPKLVTLMTKSAKYGDDSTSQKEFDHCMIRVLPHTFIPFHIISQDSFRNLIYAAKKRWTIRHPVTY